MMPSRRHFLQLAAATAAAVATAPIMTAAAGNPHGLVGSFSWDFGPDPGTTWLGIIGRDGQITEWWPVQFELSPDGLHVVGATKLPLGAQRALGLLPEGYRPPRVLRRTEASISLLPAEPELVNRIAWAPRARLPATTAGPLRTP